jgi:hypothetical protein
MIYLLLVLCGYALLFDGHETTLRLLQHLHLVGMPLL